MQDSIRDSENKMNLALDNLRDELRKIRTGRAQSSLVEDIKVSYYGSTVSLKELSTIMVPEPSMIQIKPFDRNAISDIELAIKNADLGLNPINDGNFVRVTLPPITEERRVELAKQIRKIGEGAKVSLRSVRGESWAKIMTLVKNSELTEDDKYKSEKELNDLVAKKNHEVDQLISEKETEIMKI